MTDASSRPSPAPALGRPSPSAGEEASADGHELLGPTDPLSGAAGYATAARSARTWQAYRADFRRFQRWCVAQDPCRSSLPATSATVAAYLAAHAATHRPSTLTRWCSALAVAHDLAGHPSPTRDPRVRTVLAGIRRTHRTRPDRVAAAGPPELRTMLDRLDPAHPRDARDRALILIGFAGALRRSELVALTLADLVVDTDGLRVFIAASKTDPAGTGHTRGLAYGTHAATCPVRAWQAWLAHRIASPLEDQQRHSTPPADRTDPVDETRAASPSPSPPLVSGSAFVRVDRWGNLGVAALSPRSVALIVSARATAAGLPGHWAGHSLRRGFATTAYRRGTPEIALMRHGRWRSTSAMRGYIDEGAVWVDNPTHVLGL
jgi:site-specific recombinase XerD